MTAPNNTEKAECEYYEEDRLRIKKKILILLEDLPFYEAKRVAQGVWAYYEDLSN